MPVMIDRHGPPFRPRPRGTGWRLPLAALAVCLWLGAAVTPAEPVTDFPPFWIEKISPGQPLHPFVISDVGDRPWDLKALRGKPVILLTAHRSVRYDLRKWAEALNEEFGRPGLIHLLWVHNLSRYPWDLQEHHAKDLWQQYKPPVPVLLDWHSLVGRSLRVCYDTPNLIAVDAFGRFAWQEQGPYTKPFHARIAERIRRLLSRTP